MLGVGINIVEKEIFNRRDVQNLSKRVLYTEVVCDMLIARYKNFP